MAEQKGPPRGFLGLHPSAGASGNNGGGRDFNLVLRGNVDRYEVVDAASDVSMLGEDGPAAGNKSAEFNLSRPHTKRDKQPARRGWSMETWSQIKLDVPPPEPFAFLFPKKAKKTVIRQTPLLEDLIPYTRSELLEILGMFPQVPLSAYEIKSAAESRLDLAAGRFKNEKDPARHTKGGPSMVIDENYLYTFVPSKKLGGPHRKERAETLADLDKLFVRIAHANLENTQLDTLNKKVFEEATTQKLRYEQTIRSADGFNELTYLIKAYYDKVFEKVIRARKHEDNELYYHPTDRLATGGNEESVRKQLSTFTDVNVNSWAENDLQDPSIVRSNKGVRILANDDPDLPFDERKELEFEGAVLRADQPEFDGVGDARLSLLRQATIFRKSNEDWTIYLESQIAELGEEYLTGGKISVTFDDRASRLLFKLNDDPEEATNAFFDKKGVPKVKRKDFDSVLHTIEAHLEVERGTPGSPYCRLLSFKKDLTLRKLRIEIIAKINADQWYFVLQKIPPIELKPHTTHCAHPFCDYHESDLMPAVGYRLIFMNAEHNGEPEHRLDEVSEGAGTPGRTEDGQMLFCLTCVEKLFNGVGLVRAEKPPASGERSASFKAVAEPQPPSIKPMLMAPGLDIFAATLHTFIRPEIRYTWHDFYTLNSFEYQAFMKWKNMCIRKTMWEIPSNRAFNLRIPGKAAGYDLVDFFGDDILDMSEPRPSIVIGIPLKMEEVHADDISILKYQNLSRTDAVKKVIGVKRKVSHPLSQVTSVDGMDLSELESPFGGSIVEKLDGRRTRIVKPLSEIMTLVDQRVQKAWASMVPPYVPRQSRRAPEPPCRKWPPHYFWKSEFEKEWKEEKEMDLQKVIDKMYEVINRGLKALGSEDLINYRPQMAQTSPSSYETDTRDVSLDTITDSDSPKNERGHDGRCVTCGTTKSPDWRNGPAGHNSLCNACGIRYFRKRQRRLVPPPS